MRINSVTILDTTELDFFDDTAPGSAQRLRRETIVRNGDTKSVLHMGVKSPVPWLDLYPSEFALAPQSAQILTVELHPERADHQAMAPTNISLFGQYIALDETNADALPPDIETQISIIPPVASCPNCGIDLPDGARECRRCGERIRLCPICGAPNTWPARTCRLNPAHVLRTEIDWLASPGGDAAHAATPTLPLSIHLARHWSLPAFPPGRDAHPLEWSAPLMAFGLIVASAIDTATGRASVHAYELNSGGALWDYDLFDTKGIYPDRGAMALSDDGGLYAATLGGHAVALDVIRGTVRWTTQVPGAVYGGVTATEAHLLIPAGETMCILDRRDGTLLQTLPLGGRLDTAPAYADGTIFAACDDGYVYAFDAHTGDAKWRADAGSPFDAAPIVHHDIVYAAGIDGSVYAFDTQTGAVRWRTSVSPKGISVSPALSADGLLFVAADDGFLHVIAAVSGNLIRSRRVSAAPLRISPICSAQTIFVGADDGSVYALDADFNVTRAYETTPGARLASAGFALYGDTLAFTAANGLLYVLRAAG
jgi:outer membrane protein assembly factor BamB